MLNKNEITSIISITLVLGIIISLIESWKIFGITCLSIFGVIIINTFAKKIAGHILDTEVKIKMWEWKRFGYKHHQKFSGMLPFGIIIPLIVKFISVGLINWMACLTFEVEGKVYKAAKRHGLYSFSEVTEKEMGWIATAGIWANLLFAFIAYLLGFPFFAKLNIIYAFFNIIPISNLDGAKIFFGNIPNWAFTAVVTAIALIATIITI
jgi:Zn-dependent protease